MTGKRIECSTWTDKLSAKIMIMVRVETCFWLEAAEPMTGSGHSFAIKQWPKPKSGYRTGQAERDACFLNWPVITLY